MTETTAPIPPASVSPPPGRGLKIAFAISLALNLAVAGLALGAWLHDGGPGRGMPRDLGFGPFTEALSPQDHHALKEAIRADLPGLRANREAAKAEFETLLAALRSEPFDLGAVNTAMSAIVVRTEGRLTTGQKLLADRIKAMDATERLAFADRLEEALRHGPRD